MKRVVDVSISQLNTVISVILSQIIPEGSGSKLCGYKPDLYFGEFVSE